MPTNDIQDKLNAAKAALGSANKAFPSPAAPAAKTVQHGAMPRPVAPAAPTASPLQTKGEADSIKGGLDWNAKQADVVKGSFKKGTNSVPETGVYKLHKGEKVIPAEEAKKMVKKEDKLGMATMALGSKPNGKVHMSIEPTDNDGFITKHHSVDMNEPIAKSETHVHPDVHALLKHVKSTYMGGTNSEAEAAEDADDTGQTPPQKKAGD